MPQFRYKGRTNTGLPKEGTISGQSRKKAIQKLRDQGVAQATLDEVQPTFLNKEITFGNPVKLGDFVLFLRQFATLLKSGVSIVDATNILSKQTSSKPLMRALENVEEELLSGMSFSEAAEKQKNIFPPIFVNMVRAGEATGSLDEALEQLAVQFEKQHDTKQKVKSALAYPIIIAIVATVVVIFLLTSVVPMFASMLSDLGGELPAITVFVLTVSNIVSTLWWLILIAVILLAVAIWIMRKNDDTKYYLDYFLLKLPIFGLLLQKAALARMSRTLSSLFSSSVPILQSLKIVEKVIGNEVIARTLKQSRDSLEEGKRLTEPMKDNWVFPPLVVQMISIGEETGSLDQMLGKVADFYEKEVEYATDRLKALIEPLLIVILAAAVGVIVISIIVPMFQIYSEI
ncbi:type II secretion system F family protein [Evansella cellulosilytica]|uniref:Type II secretion system F domain n=1 Tax=Evansella cellulosilytica (strain ATCC 21833 / DSM 2522 / FERM P-1141 / JCM 9156 / N-4) TaxID=649639 RepID=E6TZN8_EVAC2|nr:type II secretion system F family protein [Evansella cellulosilytica]ADU31344.1 Type II secretion system F domain [Evansella cellulosilytica DSM 2522]